MPLTSARRATGTGLTRAAPPRPCCYRSLPATPPSLRRSCDGAVTSWPELTPGSRPTRLMGRQPLSGSSTWMRCRSACRRLQLGGARSARGAVPVPPEARVTALMDALDEAVRSHAMQGQRHCEDRQLRESDHYLVGLAA